jgi:hypothetical protein
MRKLKNQKRLSRSIEKIFISKKEERPLNEVNHDPLLIKPKPEVVYPSVEAPARNQNVTNEPKSSKPELKTTSEAKKDSKNIETEIAGSKDNQSLP